MVDEGSDPFDLEGKNLRRVIPQVRKMIKVQRHRIIAAAVSFTFCLTVGYLGTRSSRGFWFVLGVGFFLASPFALLGVVMDGILLRKQKARLAECERRLNKEEKP